MKTEQWKEEDPSMLRVCKAISEFLKKKGLDNEVNYLRSERLLSWSFPDFVSDNFIDELKSDIRREWNVHNDLAIRETIVGVKQILQNWENNYREKAISGVVWKNIVQIKRS